MINRDKVQLKYICGIYRILPDYPTSLDVLYDSCVGNPDGVLFSVSKIENKYGISEERAKNITEELNKLGYTNKNKIINTPWQD